jgi:general secretion pathway protein A
MYESFFGLREAAFSLTPDPRFLWPSETHQEGLSVLEYGIASRRGFLLLTGEVGSGKTTLLRAALQRVPAGTETAMVLNTAGLQPRDLLQLIVADLRIGGTFRTKGDYILALNAHLLRQLRAGGNTVLIVDEAQNLAREALEELRLLSNLETDSAKLLQIVLTGQPELRQRLADPILRPLRQRISLEHHVEPLRRDDVGAYLEHRISVAGGDYGSVFAPGAEETFCDFSAGFPRLLNALADRVLLSAYAQGLRPAPPALVEQKAKEMLSTRALSRASHMEQG